MSTSSPEDRTNLSRRSFLEVALGTLPAAALSGGPLAALWPADDRDREVEEPYLLCKDGPSIWDPADAVYNAEPTLRDLLEVSWDQAIGHEEGEELDALLEQYVADQEDLSPEEDGPRIAACVTRLREQLDEPADLDEWVHAHDAWLDRELLRAAHSTWDLFPADRLEEAGLYLVEGDVPGSNYFSVCFDGTVDELNEALARAGVNAVVEEREQ